MRSKIGLHDMTALAAELDRFNVLDGSVCALRADRDVYRRSHAKENS